MKKAGMSMIKRVRRASGRHKIKQAEFPLANVRSLRSTAAASNVLYRRLATSPSFARRVADGIRRGPLSLQPIIQPLYRYPVSVTGANGVNVCLPRPPAPLSCFGLFPFQAISPRVTPTASELRTLALLMLPFNRRILTSREYALRIVRAINRNDAVAMTAAARETIRSPQLIRAEVIRDEEFLYPIIGFDLIFRLPGNRRFNSSISN